jgi:hypothetical protein
MSLLAGCFGTPGSSVYNATTVVYTEGSRQHTAAVELPIAPREVFASMSRIIEERPGIEILARDEEAHLIEVLSDEKQLTGQATDLGNGETLLFIWADAGNSGETGEDLALSAVKLICDDLNVDYRLVTPE